MLVSSYWVFFNTPNTWHLLRRRSTSGLGPLSSNFTPAVIHSVVITSQKNNEKLQILKSKLKQNWGLSSSLQQLLNEENFSSIMLQDVPSCSNNKFFEVYYQISIKITTLWPTAHHMFWREFKDELCLIVFWNNRSGYRPCS